MTAVRRGTASAIDLGGVIVVGLVAPFLLLQQLPAAWKAFLLAPEHVALLGYMMVGVLVALALGLTALAAHSCRRAQLIQA